MGTRHQGTEAERRALDAYIKLSRAANAVEARINGHLGDIGLSISQFGVLEALYHLGPMHQGAVAAKILRTSGNLTVVLQNLEKRDLVVRERDPQDRRRLRIALTDRGRNLIDGMFAQHVARVEATLGALDAEEQTTLARLCRKLGRAAQPGTETTPTSPPPETNAPELETTP